MPLKADYTFCDLNERQLYPTVSVTLNNECASQNMYLTMYQMSKSLFGLITPSPST